MVRARGVFGNRASGPSISVAFEADIDARGDGDLRLPPRRNVTADLLDRMPARVRISLFDIGLRRHARSPTLLASELLCRSSWECSQNLLEFDGFRWSFNLRQLLSDLGQSIRLATSCPMSSETSAACRRLSVRCAISWISDRSNSVPQWRSCGQDMAINSPAYILG
jgi:hypothetical protein